MSIALAPKCRNKIYLHTFRSLNLVILKYSTAVNFNIWSLSQDQEDDADIERQICNKCLSEQTLCCVVLARVYKRCQTFKSHCECLYDIAQ